MGSHFLKNLFSRKKQESISTVELKYFRKYKKSVDPKHVLLLLEKYKTGPTIFEPIRKRFSEEEQEGLFERIDKSDILSPQEKVEAIIGLMMILDGIFPEESILLNLEKVFGKEFVEIIKKKQKESKKDILIKRLIGVVKGDIKLTDEAKKYLKKKREELKKARKRLEK